MSFDFLTIEEAAGKVRVTRRCFDRWLAAGVGPRLHCVGHRKLIRSDDFETWIEGHAAQSQRQAVAVEVAPAASPPAPVTCEVAPA